MMQIILPIPACNRGTQTLQRAESIGSDPSIDYVHPDVVAGQARGRRSPRRRCSRTHGPRKSPRSWPRNQLDEDLIELHEDPEDGCRPRSGGRMPILSRMKRLSSMPERRAKHLRKPLRSARCARREDAPLRFSRGDRRAAAFSISRRAPSTMRSG